MDPILFSFPDATPPILQADAPACGSDRTEEAALRALLQADPAVCLESLAQQARRLTQAHFGNAIALYAPLYLSNFCAGGCAYCGFAADRRQPRRRLEPDEQAAEEDALKEQGIEQILLLTGERAPEADFAYLLAAVRMAAARFHDVHVESFPLSVDEYRQLADSGCAGVTLYQETYDPVSYARWHRWGDKRDYAARLDAPARALAAGIRTVGVGVLLGLSDPLSDALALFRHVRGLQRRFWRSGVSVSFPRIRRQTGGFVAPHPIDDARLAQLIFAFRICLPETPLVLSTRESPAFRDGMAGVGINRMSVASRTTVGGYRRPAAETGGQFEVSDERDVRAFCDMLRSRGLDPVFKDWDAVYR
jgi:2-iminoacetate synthase